jgi:hypothetical protein
MQLSPRFSIEDWNFGVCSDIDVAADQLDGWVLKPAEALAADRDAGIPVLLLLAQYFETIHFYSSGGRAGAEDWAALVGGLEQVLPTSSSETREAFARLVRGGLLRGKLFAPAFVHNEPGSFPDFDFLPGGKVLAVSWVRLLEVVRAHHEAFFAGLRGGEDLAALDRFNDAMTVRKKG